MKNFNKPLFFSLSILFLALSHAAFSQMYWHRTATFAGNSSSYVAVPNSSTTNITGSFSIEAWVNPASLSGASKGIISKGGTLGTSLRYAIRLNSNGRISLFTNGASRLTSRVSTPLTVSNWTHIAGTYNSSTGDFRIYINGLLDTNAIIASAVPQTNTDSLFIGISGASTPFNGQLDEVRLWNRVLSSAEVNQYMRTSLGTSSGIYTGLVMSIAFQGEHTNVNELKDMSGNGNDAFNRNSVITSPFNNLAGGTFYRPLHTISQNECLELDGTEDYLAGKDTSSLNLDTAITLECWVYPKTGNICRVITKGNNYGIILSVLNFGAMINNSTFNSDKSLPLDQWSYLAFTYRSTGEYQFFLNGVLVKSSSVAPATINVTSDSLYIGGGPGGSNGDFNGYLDEVRITNKAKSQEEIFIINYASLDFSNDPNAIQKNINYGFDGNTLDNIGQGGPRLFFRNNARFSHPGSIANQPVSPLNQDDERKFTKAFYTKTSNKRIPSAGTSGTVTDSLNINMNASMSDINFFVAINHTESSDLDIILIAPNGDSVKVFENKNTNSQDDNIITVFDDNADSSLIDGRYASFYCKLKPENGMNASFTGDNSKGFWKIKIRDEVSNNSGFLYSWGIQVNESQIRSKNLNLRALIQGFYDSTSNILRTDTLSANIIGTSIDVTDKAVVDKDGNCYFSFFPSGLLSNERSFLLRVTHRNSIETWHDQNFRFTNAESNIDFMTLEDQVLAENVIQIDNTPLRFAIYGGDIDQNDVVDLNDVILAFNSASNFASGYEQSDVTGDNIVDLTDVVLTFNNSTNFVHAFVP